MTMNDSNTTNNNRDHPDPGGGTQCGADPRGEEHESFTAVSKNNDQNNQAEITDEESAATAAAVRDASTTNTGFSIDANGGGSRPISASLPPGAYRCVGPGYRGEIDEAASGRANESQNNVGDATDDIVFEGFLPEPTPEELLRQEAEDMMRSAITLDDSAVRVIDDNREIGTDSVSDVEDSGRNSSAVGDLKRYLRSPISLIFLTLLLLSTIALGVAYGGSGDQPSQPSVSCIFDVLDRYDHAKLIVSGITSLEALENTTSPQNKALEWIVCKDKISSKLIDDRDLVTGLLPKQPHGTVEGDSGEAQVLRRYALATFFFATSEQGPWKEKWNFLSENMHECAWHHNKTRQNFPYGDFDPVGFICMYPGPVLFGEAPKTMLDDTETEIGGMNLNFRIPNNLTGTIPPEFGHIEGMTGIVLENQKGLHGSLPATISNMKNLRSLAILFAGPDFVGVIPSSVFTIPTIEWISFQFNEGTWEFPLPIQSKPGKNRLLGFTMRSCGLSGTIPYFISEFTSLTHLDFSGNSLEGTIPDSIGRLTSLEYLDLRDNNLNGTLTQSLGQLSSLAAMAFGKNNFQGTLPPWLGNLTKLKLLDLSYNKFEGAIPTTFCQLSSLEHVSLQRNTDLYGSISAFEPLNSLSSLLLYSNNFNSTIPSSLFSKFTGQIFADFGHNNFTGKLPQTFSQHASHTRYLAIMKNNFDDDAVDDAICEQVPTLFADCSSCPCCKSCCREDSTGEYDPFCHFDLDFYKLSGLECGSWWEFCHDDYYYPLPVNDTLFE